MSESFSAEWLELREAQDARARDLGLALALRDALPVRPRLLDLGAGTGALTRWLAPLIGRAQAWLLVDADAALLEAAFSTIAERAEQQGIPATFPNRRTLLVHAPGGAWRVEGLVANLALAPHGLPLAQADAVVCSALCDLVSADWVEAMAAACASRRLPFYAALNTAGPARFTPPHPADAYLRRGFARDQARDKGLGGRALGDAAPAVLARAFTAHGYRVLTAPSPWRIRRGDRPLAQALTEGMLEAAARWERGASRRLQEWAAARQAQIAAGRLSILVPHCDLLALPPGVPG
ncbi:MAG: class I SAM-dependent methyltransferase [Rhodovarius sp.]|nr:class I SAM-dependent methyltransferase [Rhodovarius sp.]